MRFIFNIIEKDSNGEYLDDWNDWVNAKNEDDAYEQIAQDYPSNYEITLVDVH